MNYTLDQLSDMKQAIEQAGGACLDDVCTGYDIEYPVPGQLTTSAAKTQHCGEKTLVVLPYEKIPGNKAKDAGFIRACLVCDDIGRWPMFSEVAKQWSDWNV